MNMLSLHVSLLVHQRHQLIFNSILWVYSKPCSGVTIALALWQIQGNKNEDILSVNRLSTIIYKAFSMIKFYLSNTKMLCASLNRVKITVLILEIKKQTNQAKNSLNNLPGVRAHKLQSWNQILVFCLKKHDFCS